jgi:hypothetical protein
MTILIQRDLENRSGMKLKLKINDNRSTMLSVKWEPDVTQVSLHRMFLQAPKNVMEALACYLRQKDESIAPSVRAFIEENLQVLDYSHLIDRSKLYSQGNVYNLKKIYDELNEEYYGGKLNLSITWFGKPWQRPRSRVTFGLYHDSLRLIKINRLLDSPLYPDYLVAYVVFHEMVHHVCPAYIGENGYQQIHSKEFKAEEARYRHFALAERWIKDNQANFFDF